MSSLSMFVLIIIDIFIYYIILNILDFDLFDFDHLTETCNWIALDKINRHFKKFIKTLTR